MKSRLVLGILLTTLTVPATLSAQEEYARGPLGEAVLWRVAPTHAAAFEAAAAKIVTAAGQAGLGEEYRWAIWQHGFEYGLYGPVPDMAAFDDPEAFMRQFKDTPGEATLMEAFQEFSSLEHEVLYREVWEAVPGWGYTPEQPYAEQTGYASMYESWMKPATEEKADAISKEWVAFLKEVGYGYAAAGYRVHFGDIGRLIFVTWYDNTADYYGANSFMKLVEEKAAGEKWGDLIKRWNELISRYEESQWTYRADLSYWPSSSNWTRPQAAREGGCS